MHRLGVHTGGLALGCREGTKSVPIAEEGRIESTIAPKQGVSRSKVDCKHLVIDKIY